MKVIRSEILGFCMGVRRAVDMALAEAAASAKAGAVFTLGPLIHNPQVLAGLEKQGLEIFDEKNFSKEFFLKSGEAGVAAFPFPPGAALVIRAHGVPPALEKELAERGVRLVDATCPRVKASQLKARALVEAGFHLFLAGEKEHAELAGLQGYAAAACPEAAVSRIVVGSAAEAEAAAERLHAGAPGARTALIGQSTISEKEYREISGGIKKYFPALEVVNSICDATRDRQEALRRLLDRVDAVIVAGGRESANTRRLLAIAAERGKPCWLSESPEDLPPEIFSFQTVGLSAGASTPDNVIGGIERALSEHCCVTPHVKT
ncbi:MAG: 4-hydroxy-3-methylbut-2-enyl diphosphate reductase [Treponema sp.]|jgi:4-hydroxy-3-methylbut-2-enyl diphosphate reductase|nr:4-hydroxy-3-methylbut-2-enyl diphosphate reductase [Treponema sp.]